MITYKALGMPLEQAVEVGMKADYVYMYPPRQAYRPMDSGSLDASISRSLAQTRDKPVDLYLHFPFCQRICSFCNLFTTPGGGKHEFDDYIAILIREMQMFADQLGGRPVSTLYLGGGTPSLMTVDQVNTVLLAVERIFSCDRAKIQEVAMEVAPESVDGNKLKGFLDAGIRRINFGLQTPDDEARRHMRRASYQDVEDVMLGAMKLGFDNVCVDLIYGLPEQSEQSWANALDTVLAMVPETICPYPLTVRPHTPLGRTATPPHGADQHNRYMLAQDALLSAGYAFETHVRYTRRPEGGYLQKQHHWEGADIFGFGAGARGYLRDCDFRNGYSVLHRRRVLKEWARSLNEGRSPHTSGYSLGADEKARRSVILGLFALDRGNFESAFGCDPLEYFPREFALLRGLDFVNITPSTIELTHMGALHRDLAVQTFFSVEVQSRLSTFSYQE